MEKNQNLMLTQELSEKIYSVCLLLQKERYCNGRCYKAVIDSESVQIFEEECDSISKAVSIGEFLELGGQIETLNRKIQAFVDDISERHQRRVSKMTMNEDTMKSVDKNGHVFTGFYVYLNEKSSYNYRTYEDYIWHIPIILNNDLKDGEVILEWK